jgi:hypothetical protein
LTNEDAQWDAGKFMQFIKQTLTHKPDIKDPKSVDCIKEYCVKLISHLSLLPDKDRLSLEKKHNAQSPALSASLLCNRQESMSRQYR